MDHLPGVLPILLKEPGSKSSDLLYCVWMWMCFPIVEFMFSWSIVGCTRLSYYDIE